MRSFKLCYPVFLHLCRWWGCCNSRFCFFLHMESASEVRRRYRISMATSSCLAVTCRYFSSHTKSKIQPTSGAIRSAHPGCRLPRRRTQLNRQHGLKLHQRPRVQILLSHHTAPESTDSTIWELAINTSLPTNWSSSSHPGVYLTTDFNSGAGPRTAGGWKASRSHT